jgi:hypothetical protein
LYIHHHVTDLKLSFAIFSDPNLLKGILENLKIAWRSRYLYVNAREFAWMLLRSSLINEESTLLGGWRKMLLDVATLLIPGGNFGQSAKYKCV